MTLFPSAEPYIEEGEPKRKGILYEDLRLKNRENYEVMLTQKAESLLNSPEKEPKRHNKEGELLLLRYTHGFTTVEGFIFNYILFLYASISVLQ